MESILPGGKAIHGGMRAARSIAYKEIQKCRTEDEEENEDEDEI